MAFVILVGYGLMGNTSNWADVLKNGINVFVGSLASIGFIISTLLYWFFRKNERCMYFNLGISISELVICTYIINLCFAFSILFASIKIL